MERSRRGGIQAESLRNWKNGWSRELGSPPSSRLSFSRHVHFHPWKYPARYSPAAIIERDTLAVAPSISIARAKGVLFLVKLVYQSESGRENGGDGTGGRKGWKGRGLPVCGAMELWSGLTRDDNLAYTGFHFTRCERRRSGRRALALLVPRYPRASPPVISLANIPLAITRIRLVTRTRHNYQCRWLSTKKTWIYVNLLFVVRIYAMEPNEIKLLEFGREKTFKSAKLSRSNWQYRNYHASLTTLITTRHEFE